MCTRVLNNKDKNYLATARNMDWMEELRTTLYVFDKGLKKEGQKVTKDLNGNQNIKVLLQQLGIVQVMQQQMVSIQMD